MAMTNGYPAIADIETYLAAQGVEEMTENNTNFRTEFLQFLWSLLNRNAFTSALGVWCPTTTSFNVRAGNYLYGSTVKTYVPGANVNPTDNDTTYIWLNDDNSIGSAIDGTGWPATEHVKLAEIDVDVAGIITAIRDLRVAAVNITAAT